MSRKPAFPRSKFLMRGVERYSRSESYRRSGAWAIKNRKVVPKKKEEKKVVEKPFGKQGAKRMILRPRVARIYPTEYVATPLPSRKSHHRPTRLRKSITPGTVLIILSGRFRGKRVVFIKQLPSGLLLITGPFKINGVPLRRVNQAYVIATSAKVDLTEFKIDPKFNDDYFKKSKKEKAKKTETDFFATETEKKKLDKSRIDDQKAFDQPLLTAIKKTKFLKEYLHTKFTLRKGMYPHEMKF